MRVAGEQLENPEVDQWGLEDLEVDQLGTGGPGGGPEGGPVEVQDQGLQPGGSTTNGGSYMDPSFYQQVILGVFIPLIPKPSSGSEAKL